ncbi:hypothetical protein Lesp02_84340 [Lentzea sp. NBRC 105346]|uniref:hypothetical protein n=1 Tax=Lentzea sp. NBRC 105346 TaxID=3032205 RepID=UPI0024A56908|nr:hypothetical protein [Lentzea sp. NBRC 105346]GLZ36247.1 hypothetical protein Lesp02_84340 [Lentzea sp. NBRC 105346]
MSKPMRSAVYRNVQRTLQAVQAIANRKLALDASDEQVIAQHRALMRSCRQLRLACVEASSYYRDGSSAQLFAGIAAMALNGLVESNNTAAALLQDEPAITTPSGGA